MPTFDINGAHVYAEVQGSGEPVLLLHGGFCSLESLRQLSDALVPRYRVHAWERPGHGRTADTPGEYSYEHSLADTVAFLDACGLESAHVIGFSDGAILGLLLARDHPDRVRSLVSISGNLDPSAFDAGDTGADLVLHPMPRAAADAPPNAEREHYARLSPDGPAHADVVLEKLLRLWTTQPHIDPSSLATITLPVLILAGDRDSIRPAHTLRMAAAIPSARLCIVPGATHGLLAEHPELISHVVRDFLP